MHLCLHQSSYQLYHHYYSKIPNPQEVPSLQNANMKFTTTAIATVFALLGVGIDSVSADCYTSGAFWPDQGAARFHAERACRGYDGNQGAFQGEFRPGEVKYACIQYSGTSKFEFSVQNLNTGASFDLGDDDCVLRLENEINGCGRGGESDVAGWRFR